jgi:trehalose 6-phosphate synthase
VTRRLVSVSNRVSIPRKQAAPGGLAVGVLAAMKARGGLWFGWSGELTDEGEPGMEVVRRHGASFAVTDFPRELFERYYYGFSNGMLWPLFHYFVETFHYDEPSWDAYLEANRFYADRLTRVLEADDLVWVHDYHLIPLARLLRERGARQPIGFFLHIPFPHHEVLRCLPVHEQLLADLCAFDVVGFQTDNDLRCFRDAVARLCGEACLAGPDELRVDGRIVRTGVYPIGVDVDAIVGESDRSSQGEMVRRMVASLTDRKLVLGVDRLDYSKGLVERFNAFDRFLQDHPERRGRVSLMQVAPLSRADMRAYSAIREQLEQLSGRINGRHAEADWVPIRYLNRNFAHESLMGFMRVADVGLVTPVRDGMNLVAKEFIASQDPADPGVLVLSRLAGAACELGEAVLVNPYDTHGMAEAIEQAIAMPVQERRRRHEGLLDVLRRNDIHAWHGKFVATLESVASPE